MEVLSSPSSKETIDESYIERRMIYFYRMKDAMDLMHEGSISDAENTYQLAIDLSLPVIFTIYCARGKAFSPDYFKTEMLLIGFHRFSVHKMFALLEKWRFKLPNNITEDEMLAPHPVREFPDSHYLKHVTM
jgi:hypothetical protein